jgi:hypothetical protein
MSIGLKFENLGASASIESNETLSTAKEAILSCVEKNSDIFLKACNGHEVYNGSN